MGRSTIHYEDSKTNNALKLLAATEYLSYETADSLLKDAKEICKIIGKIKTTIKTRNS